MIEFHRQFGEGPSPGRGEPRRRARSHAATRPTLPAGGLRSSDITILAIGLGLVIGLVFRLAFNLG